MFEMFECPDRRPNQLPLLLMALAMVLESRWLQDQNLKCAMFQVDLTTFPDFPFQNLAKALNVASDYSARL